MSAIEILMKDWDYSLEKGEARSIPLEEYDAKHYKWAETGNRDYDTALEERILKPVENGMLIVKKKDGSIKFDDRKLRFDRIYTSEAKPVIYVAPTHFGEMQSADVKAMADSDFFDKLSDRGTADHNDPRAYLSACFGVNAVPVTTEGYVHLFRRAGDVEVYPGHWHVIGGMLDTDLAIFGQSRQPHEILNDAARTTIEREYKQEVGADGVKFTPTGLVYKAPSTADFTLVANINSTSREFLDRRVGAEDEADHSDVAVLKSPAEVRGFLASGAKMVPVGRGSVQLYLESQ